MDDLHYFPKLKAEILRLFCEAHPYFTGELKDFGVREIALFQNMLLEKTGGRVSEKWFYTHLKKDHDRMPRIDVLDLLSQFVGYKNWGDFKSSVVISPAVRQSGRRKKKWPVTVLLFLGALTFFTLMAALSEMVFEKGKNYEVCFADAMNSEAIKGAEIKIELFRENESPEIFKADENGCFLFETADEKIVFSVNVEYFRPDTITRILRQRQQKETILLRRDDYAWMIHVFSTGNISDWKKRRAQLDNMIADEAMIFQVDKKSGRAMELFNKTEFISKMTLPVGSLGELEIVQTEYDENEKIQLIRFHQKN